MSIQLLSRYAITLFKNKSATDASQVPASGTIAFLLQGATVSATRTFHPTDPPAIETISVFDTGQIQPGMDVQLGLGGQLITVLSLVGRTGVQFLNSNTTNLTVTAGTRLVCSAFASYSDATGTVLNSNVLTSDPSTGFVAAYVSLGRFDVQTTIPGVGSRLYPDQTGGPFSTSPTWLVASDFTSFQAAIDACPDNKETTVWVPAGTFTLTDTLVLSPRKRVRLVGAGRDLTVLKCNDPSKDIIAIKGSYCSLEGLTIEGPGVAGSGRGVVIGRLAADQPAPPDILRYTSLESCVIRGTASWGLYVLGYDDAGSDANTLSIFGRFHAVTTYGGPSNQSMHIGRANTTQSFSSCEFLGAGSTAGVECIYADGVEFNACTFESGAQDGANAFIRLDSCRTAAIINCWFEQDPYPAPTSQDAVPWFVEASGARTEGLLILSTIFNRNPTDTVGNMLARAVKLTDIQGAVLSGIATYAQTHTPSNRVDIGVYHVPVVGPGGQDVGDFPVFSVSGGRANLFDLVKNAGSENALAVVVDASASVIARSGRAGGEQTWARRELYQLPLYRGPERAFILGAGSPSSGALFFNPDLHRFEFFDGSDWRYVQATVFQVP